MSENNIVINTRIIATILVINLFLFLSGCASFTYTYVNDTFPEGNVERSRIDLNACSDKVSQYVKDKAKRTTIEKKYVYIPGTPGVTKGGIVSSQSTVCQGSCAEAKEVQATTIIKCMYEKGWQWTLLKDSE